MAIISSTLRRNGRTHFIVLLTKLAVTEVLGVLLHALVPGNMPCLVLTKMVAERLPVKVPLFMFLGY